MNLSHHLALIIIISVSALSAPIHVENAIASTLGNCYSRVSVSTQGIQSNAMSLGSYMSSDGRFVFFQSYADNLVPREDLGPAPYNLYMRDIQEGTTKRIGEGWYLTSISSDARYLATRTAWSSGWIAYFLDRTANGLPPKKWRQS